MDLPQNPAPLGPTETVNEEFALQVVGLVL